MSTFTKKGIDFSTESMVGTPTLCALCVRPRMVSGKAVCRDEDCDKFDYKASVNVLCMDCRHECKQHAFVKVVMCPKFKQK